MKTLLVLAILLPSLNLCAEEPAAPPHAAKTARVVFAQYCFWTGEMALGQIDGVIRTEAGFFQGHEVTLVEYDPARISLASLVSQAKQAGVADRLHLLPGAQPGGSRVAGVTIGAPLDARYRAAPKSDQKKQLEGTPYASLRLTPEQATKVNAFVRVNPVKAREWLTSPQRAALASAH